MFCVGAGADVVGADAVVVEVVSEPQPDKVTATTIVEKIAQMTCMTVSTTRIGKSNDSLLKKLHK